MAFYKSSPVVTYNDRLSGQPVFFGGKHLRPSSCWNNFKSIKFVRNVWNDKKLADLLDKYYIFLNVHKKNCGYDKNPIAIRVPFLIQSLAIVVSELADEEDMIMYQGMVNFTKYPNRVLDEWKRQPLRVAEEVARARLALFKEKFSVEKIFRQFRSDTRITPFYSPKRL